MSLICGVMNPSNPCAEPRALCAAGYEHSQNNPALRPAMVFEKLFRYPPARPAPEVAGYGCKARLRGLDQAIPDYFLKLHKLRATVAKPACAGCTD
ncbi:MAG: hypothetical protein RMJ55_18715 [Roseiflexaceae bacterium]|nr:hypothetical protein [Roseiflexaceae bacterium]